MQKIAVVAAGGTGGHLFPAQALAEALIARGWRIVLASDERVAALAESFPAERRIGLSARTFRPGDLFGMIRAGFAIVAGVMQARAAYREIRPDVVIGFGGYPSAPGLFAALTQNRPTVLHEQNAVMGRANRRMAGRVRAVACAFPILQKAPPGVAERAVVVGNPVRAEIRAIAGVPYEPPSETGPIRLLITGGSQGARLLSELMPAAIAALPEALRDRLEVQQQTRKESLDLARQVYANANVKAEIAPFFRDMASRLKVAHLVIGRSGAGSVCEFAIAGRPAILVPLAAALDDDQGQNAQVMADAGGAVVAREAELTVETMSRALVKLLSQPDRLVRMAEGARSLSRPDAAERLADLVEAVAAEGRRG